MRSLVLCDLGTTSFRQRAPAPLLHRVRLPRQHPQVERKGALRGRPDRRYRLSDSRLGRSGEGAPPETLKVPAKCGESPALHNLSDTQGVEKCFTPVAMFPNRSVRLRVVRFMGNRTTQKPLSGTTPNAITVCAFAPPRSIPDSNQGGLNG